MSALHIVRPPNTRCERIPSTRVVGEYRNDIHRHLPDYLNTATQPSPAVLPTANLPQHLCPSCKASILKISPNPVGHVRGKGREGRVEGGGFND